MYSVSLRISETERSYDIAHLVQIGCKYPCSVTIQNNLGAYDVKSIMGMMSMNPRDGVLTIRADGPSEQEAVEEICTFFEDSLGISRI